jgi:DNA (cytosine-5)-methyltransferase 1
MDETYTNFLEWLKTEKTLTDDSASDVISRVKRSKTIMEIDVPMETELLLFHFSGKPEFKTLTLTVRSQLKRAVRLYREFKNL